MNDRYKHESGELSYDHRFHAGNIGDVWKHLAIVHCVTALQAAHAQVRIVDCHAGAGAYDLSGSGEWGEGIAKLLRWDGKEGSESLRRYLSIAVGNLSEKGGRYPGSPCIIEGLLRERDRLVCYELQENVVNVLRRRMRGATQVIQGDAVAALETLSSIPGIASLVIVDPPWTAKAEWEIIPSKLAEFCARCPAVAVFLWYPIKSYTRVAAMLKSWRARKLEAVALDLITAPLEYQRKRLNGSGLLLRGIGLETIADLSKDATLLAAHAAVFPETWELKVKAWGK